MSCLGCDWRHSLYVVTEVSPRYDMSTPTSPHGICIAASASPLYATTDNQQNATDGEANERHGKKIRRAFIRSACIWRIARAYELKRPRTADGGDRQTRKQETTKATLYHCSTTQAHIIFFTTLSATAPIHTRKKISSQQRRRYARG